MNVNRSCPICESTEADVLHSQVFELPEGHPLSAGYDVVVCSSCGFVYADITIMQVDYDRFYADNSKYEDAKTGTGGIENPFDWERQTETALQIADILQNTNTNILDVGCANGGLLKALKELGYFALCGIDPSATCVRNTQELGIDAHQGSLFVPFKEYAYDCVILSHTLEHVQDIRGALSWIVRRLKPNGLVYIETPDAERYTDFLHAPYQDFNTEHINHFSLNCLATLMKMYGFVFVKGGTKDIEIAKNLFFPAVFGFWRNAHVSARNSLNKDNLLRTKIEEYIASSKRMMLDIDARITRLINRKPSIVVWGTGQLLMKLLAETSLLRADIVAFIDNNPINHGKTLRGKPILAPKELLSLKYPVLIASLLHHDSIARQINDMGAAHEIVFLQGD